MANLTILIPAAGASRRMRGRDKLLEDVAGEPILRLVARLAVGTGAETIVTLPGSGPFTVLRRTALEGLPVRIVTVSDADQGMGASLRRGAECAAPSRGLMVVLPDMPDITTADLETLIAAFERDPDRPVRAATEDGEAGHPVIFPARLCRAFLDLAGDRGARGVLEGEDVMRCRLPGRHALTDLDTQEDWDAWRMQRKE